MRLDVRSFNALAGRTFTATIMSLLLLPLLPLLLLVPHPRVPRGQNDLSVDRIVENATVALRETKLMLIPSATVTYRAAV